MIRPKLSIVIASIPSRREKAWTLLDELEKQINIRLTNPEEVEVLMFVDNKRRSIGKKREGCVKLSNGYYTAILDDDDLPLPEYVYLIHKAVSESFQNILDGQSQFLTDVITFKSKVTNKFGSYIVDMDITNPNNEESGLDECGRQKDVKRKAWHLCAWKTELAQSVPFADVGYGEDWHWAKQLNALAKTQIKIDEVIHHYIEDPEISEAPTHSNEIWTNPNQE